MAKAAVTRSIRDDHQKNFLKIFNSLTGKHSRWEIWEDFGHSDGHRDLEQHRQGKCPGAYKDVSDHHFQILRQGAGGHG